MKDKENILVVGAGGHAKEVLDILERDPSYGEILFYDDIDPDFQSLYGYSVLKNPGEVKNKFTFEQPFIIAVGKSRHREKLYKKFINQKLKPRNLISALACIGKNEVKLGNGLNIMDGVSISSSVEIGNGILLNRGCSIHHDVTIGDFTTIGPGTQILGKCKIGSNCDIGAGVIVLPGVHIASDSIIGAGAIVTKEIRSTGTYIGIPARKTKNE